MAKKKAKITKKTTFDFSNWEELSGEQFQKLKTDARYYYYLEGSQKELDSAFKKYLKKNKYKKADITAINKAYLPKTLSVLCRLLEIGCPDYNEKENEHWQSLPGTSGSIRPLTEIINDRIAKMLDEGRLIKEEKEVEKPTNVISIQERMQIQIAPLLESFEGYIDDWLDGLVKEKDFDPYKTMLGYETKIKPAHAKLILQHFTSMIEESKEVVQFKDADIKEAYSHLPKAKQRKEFASFYEKIETACNMLIQTGKANRKPRKPKQISHEKLVAKMKYSKQDTIYSLVSISPIKIIGAQELWVFNSKTRKIGKYVADEYEGPLTVKGSTIHGFDKVKSVCKTLRKPEEQLKEFQSSGKVALRKFLDNLTTKESELTGRINGDTILLKVT